MISEVKLEAKRLLKGNMGKIWGMILLTGLIEFLISFLFDYLETSSVNVVTISGSTVAVPSALNIVLNMIQTCITCIFSVSLTHYILNLIRNTTVTYTDSLTFAGKNFLKIIVISFLVGLFEALGLVLFIIPGIIVSLGLAFVFLVMIDNPELSIMDTIKKSWKMMQGYKCNLVLFILSFIGWFLLCIFIVPMIYVIPYVQVAEIVYYERIKSNEAEANVSKEQI